MSFLNNRTSSAGASPKRKATPPTPAATPAPAIPGGEVTAVWVFFNDGTHKEFPKTKISEARKAIEKANNTRKYWVRDGANLEKCDIYNNVTLVDKINREWGADYKKSDAQQVAEKYGYIIVLLEVRYDPAKKKRVPVEDEHGHFNVIDTAPASDGPAEDA
ncbi:hypothetical protein IKE71_03635 [Candidatus Saccharibacteria bacterium]|nr:hypothetical protein [Candidatus Saccharibacteria bacterium]